MLEAWPLADLCGAARAGDGRARAGGALADPPNFDRRKQKIMTSATDIDGVNAALAAVEEGLFSSEFSNVALAGNNISLEMLQLATEVYGPDRANFFSHDPLVWENPSGNNTGAKVAIAPQTRGWHPVAASELGMASEEQSNPLKYSFVGGHYQAIDTNECRSHYRRLRGSECAGAHRAGARSCFRTRISVPSP